jgi:hypothetical protein
MLVGETVTMIPVNHALVPYRGGETVRDIHDQEAKQLSGRRQAEQCSTTAVL